MQGSSQVDESVIRALRSRYPRAFTMTLADRLKQIGCWSALLLCLGYCIHRFEIFPGRIWGGMHRIGKITAEMFPPSTGDALPELLSALLQSLGMAFLGTLIAALLAIPLGFAASRNLVPNWTLRFVLRRHFDFLRGVDSLIWALVYVRAVGLGPLAGVLAIATSDIGTLAKLFSEAIENADQRQVESLRASGARPLQLMRLGVLPQVLPVMLSNALYMFESNVRSATILGIVGAGGIGFQLADRIRAHRWDEVAFIIVMIVITVGIIDFLSHLLRSSLVNSGSVGRISFVSSR